MAKGEKYESPFQKLIPLLPETTVLFLKRKEKKEINPSFALPGHCMGVLAPHVQCFTVLSHVGGGEGEG